MKNNRSQNIINLFIVLSSLLLIKLFYLQILSPHIKVLAQSNVIKKQIIKPIRGKILDRNKNVIVDNKVVYDVYVIPNKINNDLIDKYCLLLEISRNEFDERLENCKKYSLFHPSLFLPRINYDLYLKIIDKYSLYDAFIFKPKLARKYNHNILASVLGYYAKAPKELLFRCRYNSLNEKDLVGISGLEEFYDDYLRGKDGVSYKLVDIHGNDLGIEMSNSIPVQHGKNLILTIDCRIQQYIEDLMKDMLGSVVVINVRNGEILSMVSSPSYDPNKLSYDNNFNKNYKELMNNPKCSILNRSIMASYPPGSTFKTIQGLIGYYTNVITPYEYFTCNTKIMKCHNHKQEVNLTEAIQYSCNIYFYKIFQKLLNRNQSSFNNVSKNLDDWVSLVKTFGLGEKLGIDLPNEHKGFVPDSNFYNKKYGNKFWNSFTIRSLDIGQGELLLTPLQLANVAVIIANKGYYYTPHINKSYSSVKKHLIPINKLIFNPIIEGMYLSTIHGTSVKAYNRKLYVCGKTGTAQNGTDKNHDHSIFIGFYPKEDPKIALSIVAEFQGWGADVAASLAGQIFKYIDINNI